MKRTTNGFVNADGVDLWFEQRGEGPDVLLIAGLTDPAEAWAAQLAGLSDRYRVTAFDNRGSGRSPMIPEGFTVADTADDAAALLRALGIDSAHVAGFSGGSVTAQELAVRHPDLARSLVLQSTWAGPDRYLLATAHAWEWLVATAPSEREMLEAVFLWIYTARAFTEGLVDQIIAEALAFEHPQSPEAFLRQLRTWTAHDARDRLHRISVPTLVLAGSDDLVCRPALGREVADLIPGAEFRLQAEAAHQPLQERPDEWNATVHDFWSSVLTT